MPAWDIYVSESGQVERNLSGADVRRGVESGQFVPDDLIRPHGSNARWTPMRDVPAITWPAGRATVGADAPTVEPSEPESPADRPPSIFDDDDEVRDASADSALALPVEAPADAEPFHLEKVGPDRATPPAPLASPDPTADQPPLDLEAEAIGAEPEPDEDFLAGGGEFEEEEDIDLAAMVDIAMQLVMFFLITATSVYFRSLEIPTPDPEKQKSAQQAAAPRSLQDLEDTNILVEVDGRGQLVVDHEPIVAEALVAKLRGARDATGRTAILLMVDGSAKHHSAVRVIEAASEIGLTTRLGRVSGGDQPGG